MTTVIMKCNAKKAKQKL